jgi:hypothetical protein
VGKGGLRLATILERLAQREIEMPAIFRVQRGIGQRLLHCGNIVVRKAHGLEVGKAPPRFPSPGIRASARR